jgi:hypothetical protein
MRFGWVLVSGNLRSRSASVCKTVCLSEELLVYGYTIRAALADHGHSLDDLSKSASCKRKNVLQKQISCLGES